MVNLTIKKGKNMKAKKINHDIWDYNPLKRLSLQKNLGRRRM
jgi:hypothetical protein